MCLKLVLFFVVVFVVVGLIFVGWVGFVGFVGVDLELVLILKMVIDSDGIYVVGIDIVFGMYSFVGFVGDGICYWKWMGNFDGVFIDNVFSKKLQVVMIELIDKVFKMYGC